MQHHIIYVPGIGDNIFRLQSTIIKFWRLFGVRGHCHPMPWAGPGDYAAKTAALVTKIDEYTAAGHRVSLVGASAGASAVLNAYSSRAHAIRGLIYICGKINYPETVSAATISKNPAFKEALAALQTNLRGFTKADKARFHSFYSEKDGLIPYDSTQIVGVKETKLPPLRHGMAIVYSLSLGFPKLLRVLNQVA